MKRDMPNLTALRAFTLVVRSGGVAGAANRMNVSVGAVRHQVRQLEKELGETLIVRNQRELTLTAVGSSFYEEVSLSFADIERACHTIARTAIEGELKIACASALAALRLPRVIGRFLARFPSVNLRLFQIDEADDAMDLVISFGERKIAGSRHAILQSETFFPVCSPELVYKRPLRDVEDLTDHAILHSETNEDWTRLFLASGHRQPSPRQHLYFPNAHLSLQAAKDACGIAVGSTILCADDIRCGALIRPLTMEIPAPYPYFIIQPRKANRILGDVFVEILSQHFAV